MWPSRAFHQLAGVIVSGGGELRYHGDFDWPGLAIASSVMRRHGARPWRMSAADYIAGVRADAEHVTHSQDASAGDPPPPARAARSRSRVARSTSSMANLASGSSSSPPRVCSSLRIR